ncbi:hypothetical protein WJX72_003293 [[Myrmecia] bisecta]|uniref:Uncharacterized protein n=1 Tax=[Myrmecia] bisecta TaxID=41462 RepID=A0AAW1P589_9CHLO
MPPRPKHVQRIGLTTIHPMRVEMLDASGYLQYIVDHYDRLPDAMVFMHAHQKSKHMPDKVPLLKRLRWGSFEFANLRYQNITFGQWGKWTGDWLSPQHPREAPPAEEVIWDELRVNQSTLFAGVWNELLADELGLLPRHVHAPASAEFLIAKQRILRHSKAFYERCLGLAGADQHGQVLCQPSLGVRVAHNVWGAFGVLCAHRVRAAQL